MYANGELCGFTSTLTFVHPKVKNTKQGHRTVILPDFQGVGLGVYLRDFIAEHYRQNGFSYITTTSNPALVHSMKNSPKWICTRYGRTVAVAGAQKGIGSLKKTISGGARITTSWRYIG